MKPHRTPWGMNRAARRAAHAQCNGDSSKNHRITKVHEAGHAIGRILTADAFGIPVENSVVNIVMQAGVATTYGPMFPAAIAKAKGQQERMAAGDMSPVFDIMAIEEAREQGADIEAWLRAKLMICVLGPVVEAKLTDRNPFEVFDSPECEGDRNDAFAACQYYSSGAERGAELIEETIRKAMRLLEQPNVWRAVLAVADLLPKRGTVPGDKIIQVAMAALADEPLKKAA
jgi:hypothetical protein